LDYKELIPCNCNKCTGSPDPERYPYGMLMQFLHDRQYAIDCRKSYTNVDVRRLISDITAEADIDREQLIETMMNPGLGKGRRIRDVAGFGLTDAESTAPNVTYNIQAPQINQSSENTMSDNRTQQISHGSGDNVAGDKVGGDKVAGDKIGNQFNNNPDLAQAARDIKALLDELSDEYNPATPKGQTKIKDAALAQIKDDPTLRQRVTNALKSAGAEALDQAVQHPVAKVVIEGAKGFLE
ncbi:MAG: hypothetical protein AAFY15_06450, partial [Cyanobacteria bacterium J06648_11]